MKASLSSLVGFFIFAVVGLFLLPAAASAVSANLKLSPRVVGGPGTAVVRGGDVYSAYPGSKETIRVEVQNVGSVASKKSKTSMVATALSGADEGSKIRLRKTTKQVKAGKSRKLRFRFAFADLSVGQYDLVACADAKQQVKEFAEKDNCVEAVGFEIWPANWTGTVTGSGAPFGGPAGVKQRSWSAGVSFDSCALPELAAACADELRLGFLTPYKATGSLTITHDGCDGAPAETVPLTAGTPSSAFLELTLDPRQYEVHGEVTYTRPDCTFAVTQSDGTVTQETIPGGADTFTWLVARPAKKTSVSWDPAVLRLAGSCPSDLFRDCSGQGIQVAWDLAGS